MQAAGIETFRAVLPHGIELACRAAGPHSGAPRVVLLHGFPEAAFVWDDVLLSLAPAVRGVAPNLRGYAGSSAPADVADYRARHLVADVAALIEQLGAPIDLLVAHDWGGALAWSLAATRPDLLRRLLILNSPHPATFLRELREDPEQQAASAYMSFLCRPDAAALLAEDGYARLFRFFHDDAGRPPAWLDEATAARYREAWGHGLDGGLNYYRASPLRPALAPGDTLNSLVLPDESVTVRVPTTVLWGQADRALRPGLLRGLERWVPQLDLRLLPTASHWLVHEQPEHVAQVIRELVPAG